MNHTDTDLYDISYKIKLLRINKGLSQKELAKLLGVNTSVVSKYETSAVVPSISVIKKLTKVFNVCKSGFVEVQNRYRKDGGKSSNLYKILK